MASMSWRDSLSTGRTSSAGRALGGVFRELGGTLGEPGLWLLVLLTALAGSLAYRAPYSFALDVGGSPKSCYAEAVFDTPYIHGFNPEPEFDGVLGQCATRSMAYRWAFDDASVRLEGVGQAAYSVVLKLAAGQPSGVPVVSALDVDAAPTLALPVAPDGRTYELLTPAPHARDLELRFRTPAYQPPGDPRTLAFAVDRLRLASVGPITPDWVQLLRLGALVGVGYLLARRWRVPAWPAAGALALVLATIVGLLVWQRQGLTSYTGAALRLVLLAYGLSLIVELAVGALARRLSLAVGRYEVRIVSALIVAAWLIRVLGLFHPQTFSSDVGLNINNLIGVTHGELIFTETLPSEAGGGAAPYPPAQYVMLLPWQLLHLDLHWLVTAANALADSLTIGWLWLVMRACGGSTAAGLGAGLLYLFATPLLRSLSTGEMANVWGQALVAPWLLALVLWRQRRIGAPVLGLTTAAALLGHSGVFLSLGLLLGSLGLLWLIARDRQVWRFALVGVLAVSAVGVGYYSGFVDILAQNPAAPAPTTSVAQRLAIQARQFVTLSGQLGPLLTLLGLGGLPLAWRRLPALGEVLAAWWLATLLSWVTLLWSQQALRWEIFLFPAVVLGGGLVLGLLWSRRGQLRWLAGALVSAVLAQGGILWVQRLITYR